MMTKGDPPAGVGEKVADVLRAAYYYALVDGHGVVDPGQVLVAAARNDDRAARVLGKQVVDARTTTPQRKSPEIADHVDSPQGGYAGALREACWWVLRDSPEVERGSVPVWSTAVGAALDRAAASARSAGVTRLDVPHLLLGLLEPAEPSVAALIDRVGLDIAAARLRVEAGDLSVDPAPFVPLFDLLRMAGATQSRAPWLVRWVPGWVARFAGREAKWGGPVMPCLEREVMRQAVMAGHDIVQSSDVLLAIVSLDLQLAAAGERLAAAYLPNNQGGGLLDEAGFDLEEAQSVAVSLIEEREVLSVDESSSRFWDTGKLGDPLWSVVATRVMDRATGIAREHGHHNAGSSHLLAAVLVEDGAAGHLLAELNLDREDLRQRVSHQLAQS
ncbi:Clp protease N-terminal domain-containing protein [Micromonospora sp. NPDC050276]|uniref:Clp protease N-terminal domain-containing protein n=1 Tax=Micromonospora sp. NPDC050276 TaxID=3364278 RepID=UPI0037AE80B2